MKKYFSLMLSLFIFINFTKISYAEDALSNIAEPKITGSYAVSIDARTGTVLYDKGMNVKAYPASITKIMTALLMLENLNADDTITMSHKCIEKTKSNEQIFLQTGETMSRNTALFTMLTLSANDIACAVGEKIAGSEAEFGKMMTEKAKELGAESTSFKNPSGLHDPNHYTTAYDMSIITQAVIQNDLILKAMNTKKYIVNTNLQKKRPIARANPEYDSPHSIGEKTGFTDEAHNTLVDVDEKEGKRVITVILGANTQVTKKVNFDDARRISDYAFENLGTVNVIDETQWSESMDVLGNKVNVIPEKSVDEADNLAQPIHYRVTFSPKVINEGKLYETGIQKGEVLGVIKVIKDGQIVDEINGIASSAMSFEKPPHSEHSSARFLIFLPLIFLVIMSLFILFKRKLKMAASPNINQEDQAG